MNKKLSYLEIPCERCGSKKKASKPMKQTIQNSFGTSDLEVTMIVCTNTDCQNAFDTKRSSDLIASNQKRQEREERNKERRGASAT